MGFIFPTGSIKYLMYLVLVTCMTIISYLFFAANPQSHWMIWSAFSLSIVTSGKTFGHRIAIISATGLIVMITVFIASWFASNMLLLAIYLFLVTGSSVLLAQRYPEMVFPALIIGLFTVVSGMSMTSIQYDLDRSQFVAIGALLAILPQIIFWPNYMRDKLRSCMTMVLRSLRQINVEILSFYLQPEYFDNVYLYERRLHVQKNKFMQSMLMLREMITFIDEKLFQDKRDVLNQIESHLERAYDVMIDCALLRLRVTDYTIFSVCLIELSDIEKALSAIYFEIIRMVNGEAYQVNLMELDGKIKRLEENYQNVLQVTAREPLVFLLYVASLKALYEEIVGVYESIMRLNMLLEHQ